MLTALIAEDELLVRMGISSSVPWSELDIAVVGEAGDGLEAWKLYQKYRPDIIILDILMPGMSGVELLERIRQVDLHCAVIVVTNIDKGDDLDKVRKLDISGILHKMTMKRDDISETVRRVCDALRPAQDDPSSGAMREKKAWEDLLSGNGTDKASFEAQGITGIRLFPNDRLTPALQRSLSMLILQRLGEPGAYVPVNLENCQLLIWKDPSARQISGKMLMDFARYVQDNFHIDMGVVTVFSALENEQLPHMTRRLVTMLQEPRLFDHPVLLLNERGDYVNERLETLRKEFTISLPICADRDEMMTLKYLLDRYPGALDDDFERILRNAAVLLQALELSAFQPSLWEMTRRICESTEERLSRVTPKVRPEIHTAMAYFQEHLMENIPRNQLGKLSNYDSVYFSKLFKMESGMSYTDYLLQARMLRAQKLILETDIPFNDIAAMCGFSNYSYFCQRFRQFCGVAPHEWRKNNSEAMV